MRVKNHYSCEIKKDLIRFLEKNEIPYEIFGHGCYFDIYEDQEAYRKFRKRFFVASLLPFKSTEYSKQEIENAEWLTVRSKSSKVILGEVNDKKIFAKTCSKKRLFLIEPEYRHTTQIGCLNVEKKVKWGTRQFFSGPDAVLLSGLLFCSERTRQLLAGQWDGLEFWPVKKYKTDKVVPDLFQMIFTEELPIEAITGGKLEKCRGCGKKIMRFNKDAQNLTLRKEFLTDPYKVYCTGDVLVPEQLIACETFSLNIVSQEFYRYCEKRQMNRGMIYEPIKVI